jgi:putative sugar O-methyltransferase
MLAALQGLSLNMNGADGMIECDEGLVDTECRNSGPAHEVNSTDNLSAAHFAESTPLKALLKRICLAYTKAQEHESEHVEEYGPTSWWQDVRDRSLSPVQAALTRFDIAGLQRMYEKFYRDPCSKGLVGWPRSWKGAGDREHINEAELRAMREETLYRIEYWRTQTGGKYPVSALESPHVGKPFGVCIDGTLVVSRSEYHHACAHRIAELTGPESRVVEIGGGYGAMACFLLAAAPGIRYAGFDLPETLALAAYYLGCAFPERRLVLYGEEGDALDQLPPDAIVLLPPWKMVSLAEKSVDATFSSHLLCDLAPLAQEQYLAEIARFTRGLLLHYGRDDDAAVNAFERHFERIERRRTAWHFYRDPHARECELLLRPRH